MIDFKLDDSYDISLDPVNNVPRFKLQFSYTENPTFLIQFSVRGERQEITTSLPRFQIVFQTEDLSDKTKYAVSTVTRLNEIVQALQIRLKTELSEIPADEYSAFGSELVYTRHQDLVNETTLSQITQYTIDAIADILDDGYTVQSFAEPDDSAGYFYCQHVNVYIYDRTGTEVYRFSI